MATLQTQATRPSGNSIPDGKAYFETSTNQFIVWDAADEEWIQLDSDGSGAVPPPYYKYSITMAAAGDFTLNFDAGNDITVAWGDGDENTSTETDTSFTHTYSAAGDYEISISVNSEVYGTDYFADVTSQNSITSVTVDPGFLIDTDWSSLFMRNRNLTSINFPEGFANNVTGASTMFRDCNSLTPEGLPEADFQSVTDISKMFYSSSVSEFPSTFVISSTNITTTQGMFFRSDLITAPPLNLQNCTNVSQMFQESEVTSIPLYDLSSVTNASSFLQSCDQLLSLPQLNLSSCTNFQNAFYRVSSISSFPEINTSAGTNFSSAFRQLPSLTSFPSLDFSNGTAFANAWRQCSSLTTFPANAFNNTGTLVSSAFTNAFNTCALNAQSIENILVSLDTNGATGVALHINGGTNAGQSTWTAAATAAYNNLLAKSWTISTNA